VQKGKGERSEILGERKGREGVEEGSWAQLTQTNVDISHFTPPRRKAETRLSNRRKRKAGKEKVRGEKGRKGHRSPKNRVMVKGGGGGGGVGTIYCEENRAVWEGDSASTNWV